MIWLIGGRRGLRGLE
uniref:Uncharacterized protein n=1 Tax=Anguilla anguilla TaxID=7936 RepID=A0A0E9UBD4_ANGAN